MALVPSAASLTDLRVAQNPNATAWADLMVAQSADATAVALRSAAQPYADRLAYYMGACNTSAPGSIDASSLSSEPDIDIPFLFSPCAGGGKAEDVPECRVGHHPNCGMYAATFTRLLRDVGMGSECVRLPTMWGDRTAGGEAAHRRRTALWVGEPMPMPVLVKTRTDDPNVPGILLKTPGIPGRHWGFLNETPPPGAHLSWEKRRDALIWRGGRTGVEHHSTNQRQTFVDGLVGRKSEGIDVTFADQEEDKMSEDEMMQYRYSLSLEGNDVATDLKWKLASGMVVLMPRPTTESWLMEFALRPDVHYMRVHSPAEVPKKLKWLQAHPQEARRMSDAARAWMLPFTDKAQELNLERDVLRKTAALVQALEFKPREVQSRDW